MRARGLAVGRVLERLAGGAGAHAHGDRHATGGGLDDRTNHERALLAGERPGLAHRAGRDEPVHAGLDQLLDVLLERRDVDLVVGGERGGDGGDDAFKGH
jgi:hypothetical protein